MPETFYFNSLVVDCELFVRATVSHILNWVFHYCTVPYTTEILSKVMKMKSTLKVWEKFSEEINNYLVLTKAG